MPLSAQSINEAARSSLYGPSYYGPMTSTYGPPSFSLPSAPGTTAVKKPNTMYKPPTQPTISSVTPGLQGIQAGLQASAGVPTAVDKNLTQDAFAGNIAMALRQRAGGTDQSTTGTPSTATPPQGGPAGGPPSPGQTSTPQAGPAAGLYGVSTPTVVQGAGLPNEGPGGYAAVTTPFRAQQPGESLADYAKARIAYLTSQQGAQQQADLLNEPAIQRREMQANEAALATKVQQIDTEEKGARDDLINKLAARGITVANDSFGQAKMNELTNLYNEKRQAAQNEEMIANAQIDENSRKRLQEANDAYTKNLNDQIATLNQTISALSTESYKTGMLGINEDRVKIAQQRADTGTATQEDLQILREAQAAKANAEAEFTSGAKTGLTEAQTTAAQARAKLSEAQTAKVQGLLGKSAGGAGTTEEFNKAYDALLAAGVQPTDKAVALAVRRMRGEQNPTIPEEALAGVTARSKAQTAGKTGPLQLY